MGWKNFILTIHILGAVFIFGPTVAYAFIGAQAKKEGAPVAWALGLVEFIENKWVTPLALTLQPLSGALLILDGDDLYNPFESRGRWLLVAIILYIVAMGFAIFVQGRTAKKALHLAESNQFGPEFGALMKKVAMGGQFLTVLLIAIIVLMVVKPGSNVPHL
ncbi:MAG TPA: DUF2269 family protein [Actinomycetota bacterium]|nr:DUF2269 family protein [Actinomycetota bacterium]